jgi:hypothetical protein
MPKKKTKKNKDHAHILIPDWQLKLLREALKRRAAIAAKTGEVTPTSFSGWVREQAAETCKRWS